MSTELFAEEEVSWSTIVVWLIVCAMRQCQRPNLQSAAFSNPALVINKAKRWSEMHYISIVHPARGSCSAFDIF